MFDLYIAGGMLIAALLCLAYHKLGKGLWARLDALLAAIILTATAFMLVVIEVVEHVGDFG